MAFNTNAGKQQFTATAGQTVFTFNFAIFQDTNLKVYLTPSGNTADDTADILALSTNYTVVVNGTVGGTVTLLVGAGINDTVTIVRVLPIARDTDYVTNGDFYADTLDADQDYQTYLVQDGFVQLERAIIIPESSTGVDLNIPAPVANSYLRWNATADALENDTSIPNDVVTTNNNVILTNADVVLTHADVVTTANSALEAEHWANYTTDVAVPEGTGEFSAKHYATKAAASASSLLVDATPTNGSTNAVSSNGVFDALALKAPLSSPAFTDIPTAPTATAGTNTTQIATTAFVLANSLDSNNPSFIGKVSSSDETVSVTSGVYSSAADVVTVILTVASHTVVAGDIINISGITNAQVATGGSNIVFNGYHKVDSVTSTTLTITISTLIGTVGSTALTGTISFTHGGLYLDSMPKIKSGANYYPIQVATAFVSFDGTTTRPTIKASFGVSAIVKSASYNRVYFDESFDTSKIEHNFTFSVPTISTTAYGGYTVIGTNYIDLYIKQHTGDTWAFSNNCNLTVYGGK